MAFSFPSSSSISCEEWGGQIRESGVPEVKFFVISDNIDTYMGMRLAGIEGVVVHEREAVVRELARAVQSADIGIVLITNKLMLLCPDVIYEQKLKHKRPLIVEIPDRHGGSHIAQQLQRYVGEAVGIKL